MVAIYGLAVSLGVLLLLGWIGATAAARGVPEWGRFDPEARFGRTGRLVVAGLVGFGLGGLSASFAGWPSVVALAAAFGGAALMGTTAILAGPDGRPASGA